MDNDKPFSNDVDEVRREIQLEIDNETDLRTRLAASRQRLRDMSAHVLGLGNEQSEKIAAHLAQVLDPRQPAPAEPIAPDVAAPPPAVEPPAFEEIAPAGDAAAGAGENAGDASSENTGAASSEAAAENSGAIDGENATGDATTQN